MFDKTIKKFHQVRERIGFIGLIEAALHPVLIPFYAILAWARTLWAARTLLFGQWSSYHGFHPLYALNSFFYKTQWLNFERYSRRGISDIAGLGNYPLTNWFHLSLFSSCLYAQAGAVTTLFGTLTWMCLHLFWLDVVPGIWLLCILLICFFSSTTFSTAFVRQNYNILGWMWVPLGLYGVLTEHWILAALAWLAASLSSITSVFAVIPLMVVYALSAGRVAPVLVLLPAILKLGLHFLPLLSEKRLHRGLLNTMKLIGVTKKEVRYKRTSMRFSLPNIYLSCLYATGCGLLWLGGEMMPVLPLSALLLFIVNQRIMRFADDQSVIMLFVTVYTATLLSTTPTWLGLLGLIIVFNPLSAFLGLASSRRDGTLVRFQPLRPFNHVSLQTSFEQFFESVPAKSKIYFAFENPGNVYERIFDGYRILIELPLFVAASRDIHLFPDWYAVAETNYQGAPNCWGRSVEDVFENARNWGASYAIVYQDPGTTLEEKWEKQGFQILASFDWNKWEDQLDNHKLWTPELPPCWWLLKVPSFDL